MDGCQEYGMGKNIYRLEGGSFILIYPNTPHKVTLSLPDTKKFSITFNKSIKEHTDCYFGTFTKQLSKNIDFILKESLIKKEISSTLIENNILEIIVLFFRSFGIKENDKVLIQDKNMIISLAKKFIDDNIENSPSVLDVAEYCYLSAIQLTRIFYKFEGISPGEYITNKRIWAIEKLLADNSFFLKQISEIMGFNNEHYFNAFLKRIQECPPVSTEKCWVNKYLNQFR